MCATIRPVVVLVSSPRSSATTCQPWSCAAAIRSANPTTLRLILSSRVASRALASPEASSLRARSNAGRTLPRFALTSSTRTSATSQPRRSTSDRSVVSCASRLRPLLACSSEDTRTYRIAFVGPDGRRRRRVGKDADTEENHSNGTLAVGTTPGEGKIANGRGCIAPCSPVPVVRSGLYRRCVVIASRRGSLLRGLSWPLRTGEVQDALGDIPAVRQPGPVRPPGARAAEAAVESSHGGRA